MVGHNIPFLVDRLTERLGEALQNINVEELSRGFQVDGSNPLVGVKARAEIIQRLGASLQNLPDIFGPEGRPGRLVGKCYFPPHG